MRTYLIVCAVSALSACAVAPPVVPCKVEQYGAIARVDGRLTVTARKPAALQCAAVVLEKDPLQQHASSGLYIPQSYLIEDNLIRRNGPKPVPIEHILYVYDPLRQRP